MSSPTSPKGRRAGQVLFAIFAVGASALLLSQIDSQTKWVEGTKFAAQPRFWPAVGLFSMTVFAVLHLWRLPRRAIRRDDWREGRKWLEPLEYAVWFMGYVFLVPVVGFLPMTVGFAVALTLRLGYRGGRWMLIAALFGIAVVLIFKAFLGVKIPGAAFYEIFPEPLRSFAILNL